MKKITKFFSLAVSTLMMLGAAVGVKPLMERADATEYEELFTINCEDASKNGSENLYKVSSSTIMTDVGILAFLNKGAGATIFSTASVENSVYWAKGSGGSGIPNDVLKIGKATGNGSISFTYSGINNISKVSIVGYGWKTTTEVAVNGSSTQSPSVAATLVTFDFVLTTATKAIDVDVTTSCFCATSIVCYKELQQNAKTITYVLDDGGVNDSRNPSTYSVGTGVSTLYPATRPGYDFVRWELNGEEVTNISAEQNTDITLTAIWQEKAKFAVTFDGNGSDATYSYQETISSGEYASIPASLPTKDGYKLMGWSLSNDNDASKIVNLAEYPINKIETFYAVWAQIFTVTFVTGEGASAVQPIEVAYGEKINKPTNPTKTGFGFFGWFKDAELKSVWDFDVDKATTNTTLYAKWLNVYSHTMAYKEFTENNQTKTLDGASWTISSDSTYFGAGTNEKGPQFGSSSSPAKFLSFSTSTFKGPILRVVVNASGGSSIAATLSVSVGDTKYGESKELTSTATDYTFEGTSKGDVTISFVQTSSKALYVKSIYVLYDGSAYQKLNDPSNASVTNGKVYFDESSNADEYTKYYCQVFDSSDKEIKHIDNVSDGTDLFTDINKVGTYSVRISALAGDSEQRINADNYTECEYRIEVANYPEVTIAELLSKEAGNKYCFYSTTGIITSKFDDDNDKHCVLINDGTAEVECYNLALSVYDTLSEGQTIKVSGYFETYNGINEICNCVISSPEANIYLVTFDSNGGNETYESQYVQAGSLAINPSPSTDPTKDECSFGGWFDGDSEWNFASPVNKNLNLKAKWVLNSVTNSFENSSPMARIAMSYNETSAGYSLVTDVSTLKAGDVLVLGCTYTKGGVTTYHAAGNIASSVMSDVTSSLENNKFVPGEDAIELTLGGTSGNWTLSNNSGDLLGATDVKKLAWGSGTTTWSISIEEGKATIQNGTEKYGRFLYNAGSPRFAPYTSDIASDMLLPSLYKKSESSYSLNNASLQFGMFLDTEIQEAIKTNDAEAEFGMLYCRTSHLDGDTIADYVAIADNDFSELAAANIYSKECNNGEVVNGKFQFGVSINGITKDTITTEFTACGYLIYKGQLYLSTEVTYSLKSLAKAYVDATDTSAYSDHLGMLEWLSNYANAQ